VGFCSLGVTRACFANTSGLVSRRPRRGVFTKPDQGAVSQRTFAALDSLRRCVSTPKFALIASERRDGAASTWRDFLPGALARCTPRTRPL